MKTFRLALTFLSGLGVGCQSMFSCRLYYRHSYSISSFKSGSTSVSWITILEASWISDKCKISKWNLCLFLMVLSCYNSLLILHTVTITTVSMLRHVCYRWQTVWTHSWQFRSLWIHTFHWVETRLSSFSLWAVSQTHRKTESFHVRCWTYYPFAMSPAIVEGIKEKRIKNWNVLLAD